MQKSDKKASILLWSIFISMMLIVAFIAVNNQIIKNLGNNEDIIKRLEFENQKNESINLAKNKKIFENITFKSGEKIIFEEDNIINIGLKKSETYKINLSEKNTNITIKIIEGSPIEYYNSNQNGLIINLDTFNVFDNTLNLKNLGGYSKIQITSENKFVKQHKKYKIVKEYPNKVILKEKGEINLSK